EGVDTDGADGLLANDSIQDRSVFRRNGRLREIMRYLTRILLVLILLVPILWVWPQRGITVKFHPNRYWLRPAVVRVERQINLDFMTTASASLPQQDFSVEWSGWLRTDRDGQYACNLRSDDGSTRELDWHV